MATPSVHEQTKRRIESALSAFSPKRQRPSAPSTSVESRRKSTTTVGSVELSGDVNKFRPWSHEDLLERISTYKPYTWLVQSPMLSPVRCARNGWINTDCSTLKCPQCSALLIAQLPDDLTEEEEVRWIERLVQQLQTSHSEACPWKGRPCAENVYSVPLATSRETVDEVCQHAATVLLFGEQLPTIEQPLTASQRGLLRDLIHRVVDMYKTTANSDSAPDDTKVLGALSLALFGWRADQTKPQAAVKCELCFRSAGLWLFQGAATLSADDCSPSLHAFNVVDEHRSFCYWARGSDVDGQQPAESAALKQSATGAIPGWKKIIASILRAKTIDISNQCSLSDASSADSDHEEAGADEGARAGSTSSGGGPEALQKLKPFNISAISSAAEAFGIPFNVSQLALVMHKLASNSTSPTAVELPAKPAPATTSGASSTSPIDESSVLLRTSADGQTIIEAQSDWDNDDIIRPHLDSGDDTSAATVPADDGIPEPIDTSGLASLLGGSSLADALEDPTKANAILEYVKGLLKARNRQPQSPA
ncbi:hypothetical protein LPJ70_000615 [Coemansia sp. RSA 2708]|nr:hypothetical protein LPJ70_000615 [Coemansia sp. RSA 2708]